MTRVFTLLDSQPSGFGVDVHPERIRIILGRREALRVMRDLVEALDRDETYITLHGSWVPELPTPLFPS